MIKEYMGVYLVLMLKNDKEKQKKLLKSLKKYLETIKIENEIYKILEENQTSKDLTLYKEPNFLVKFFNMIKGIFNKNKF